MPGLRGKGLDSSTGVVGTLPQAKLVVVGGLVILGRSLHAQPLVPRYIYIVIGSQNTNKHDLSRKWTQYMTSDVTFILQQCPGGVIGTLKVAGQMIFAAPMHCETLCMLPAYPAYNTLKSAFSIYIYIYEDKEIVLPCGAQFEQSYSFPFLGFPHNYFSSMILIWVFRA